LRTTDYANDADRIAPLEIHFLIDLEGRVPANPGLMWETEFPMEGRPSARPGQAEARPSGNEDATPATTDKSDNSVTPAQAVEQDLPTRQCRWIFGGYRLRQRGRSARRGDGGLRDKRIRFPKR
jgi:hypothetical protein